MLMSDVVFELSHRSLLIFIISASTILWWNSSIISTTIISIISLVMFMIFDIVGPEQSLKIFNSYQFIFMLGAFLIAKAISNSGLSLTIANKLLNLMFYKKARNSSYLIITIYVLNIIFSLFIPLPLARSLILHEVFDKLNDILGININTRRNIILSIYSSSAITGVLFLSSSPILNNASLIYYPTDLYWIEWSEWLFIPGLLLLSVSLAVHLLIHRFISKKKYMVILDSYLQTKLSDKERVVAIVILFVVILWFTQPLHNVNNALVALLAACFLSIIYSGSIINEKDVKVHVEWNMLLYLSAAITIGIAIGSTEIPTMIINLLDMITFKNLYLIALVIGLSTLILHMVLGSVLTTISIITPIYMHFCHLNGINPLFALFLVNLIAQGHAVLPFHNATLLIGSGMKNTYSAKDVIKHGLIVMLFIPPIIILSVWVWKLQNLI